IRSKAGKSSTNSAIARPSPAGLLQTSKGEVRHELPPWHAFTFAPPTSSARQPDLRDSDLGSPLICDSMLNLPKQFRGHRALSNHRDRVHYRAKLKMPVASHATCPSL